MFRKIKKSFMSALGITKFETSADGKDVLTAEQRTQLVSKYGESFIAQFEKDLLAEVSNETTPEAEQAADVALTAAVATANVDVVALREQLATAVTQNASLQEMIGILSERSETVPAAEGVKAFVEGVKTKAIERSFKVDMSSSHYAAAQTFVNSGVMAATPPTIDVADLRKEFGTFLTQGVKMDVYTQLFQGFDTAPYMTTKLAITEWRATEGIISSVVQQFTPQWTPKGKSKFTPIIIKNRRHKINVPIIPNDIVESWLMYLYDESLSPDKMPITRYIMQNFLLPKILEDIELRMIAKGKYDEGAADALAEGAEGLAAEKGMDGFETILVEAKKVHGTDKSMGVKFFKETIVIETCTDDEILKFIQDFVSFIAPMYRRKNLPVFCSPEFYTRYKIAFKNKWGAGSGTTDPNFGGDRIDFSTNILTPLVSMYASPIVFTTPKENFIKLRSKNAVPNIVNDIQVQDYKVKIFGEFWLGCGFAIGEAVTASVPDNYDPVATISACYGSDADWKGANAAFEEVAPAQQSDDNGGSL